MFGQEILNGKQICEALGISSTLLYKLIASGLPYHQLTKGSRKYYYLEEVKRWLLEVGYHQRTTWTK